MSKASNETHENPGRFGNFQNFHRIRKNRMLFYATGPFVLNCWTSEQHCSLRGALSHSPPSFRFSTPSLRTAVSPLPVMTYVNISEFLSNLDKNCGTPRCRLSSKFRGLYDRTSVYNVAKEAGTRGALTDSSYSSRCAHARSKTSHARRNHDRKFWFVCLYS